MYFNIDLLKSNKTKKLSPTYTCIKYIKKYHFNFYEYLINIFPNSIIGNYKITEFKQLLYHYLKNIKQIQICEECKINHTKFRTFKDGYNRFCGRKCRHIFDKKYRLEKYGCETYTNSKKMKQTKLERHGNENYVNPEKAKQTFLLRLGVDNNMKDPNLFAKNQRSRFQVKQYKETELYYQANYEYNFLELCESLNMLNKIEKGPTIRYKINNKYKIYHSDFYINDLNLIIEIKSGYWYRDNIEETICKKKASIYSNYNYCIVIDNDFNEFIKLISQ